MARRHSPPTADSAKSAADLSSLAGVKEPWTNQATGIQPDGAILTATNVMTRVDDNTFTWQSTQRTLDGINLGDLPPVRVTRAKSGK